MAGFGIFCNGTVVLYKVLCIFVKAWWCIFATFLSRKTLWASFEQQTDEKKLVKIIKLENNSLECGKP
jgi:hypothetical protein